MKTFQVQLSSGQTRKVEADRFMEGNGGIQFFTVEIWSPRKEHQTDWFRLDTVDRITRDPATPS